MATRIDIKNTEFNRLFCENVKRMFVKKLKKRNISVSISIPEDVWLKDLYQGDMGSDKKFNIAHFNFITFILFRTALLSHWWIINLYQMFNKSFIIRR